MADNLGDEGIAKRFGPLRVAVWLRNHNDYWEDNSRLWALRRAFIEAPIWSAYGLEEVPLIPEWFGAVLPHGIAWERTGHPHVWCTVFGFPTRKLRAAAIEIIEAEKPAGLMLLERDAPDPIRYMLPVVGFIAQDVYLTLEPEHPRRYDHATGYETLGLVPDAEAGLMELVAADYAERMLVRRLALSLGRWVTAPAATSDFKGMVRHARELWSLGATTAAGAVAGTALENLLKKALDRRESEWPSRGNALLGPLIDKTVKHFELDRTERATLDGFRVLRNTCAHAIADESGISSDAISSQVNDLIGWLEAQTFAEVEERGPHFVRRRPPCKPRALHARATAAGLRAADAQIATPMKVDGAVVEDGAAGIARIFLKPGEPLAEWLVETGQATGRGGWVSFGAHAGSQSVEKAGAYAQAYVKTLLDHEVFASYETHLD